MAWPMATSSGEAGGLTPLHVLWTGHMLLPLFPSSCVPGPAPGHHTQAPELVGWVLVTGFSLVEAEAAPSCMT